MLIAAAEFFILRGEWVVLRIRSALGRKSAVNGGIAFLAPVRQGGGEKPSRRSSWPIPPLPAAASASIRILFLYSAVNVRRLALGTTSGSIALPTTAVRFCTSFMIHFLPARLSNQSRWKCLTDVGTKGAVIPSQLVVAILRVAASAT